MPKSPLIVSSAAALLLLGCDLEGPDMEPREESTETSTSQTDATTDDTSEATDAQTGTSTAVTERVCRETTFRACGGDPIGEWSFAAWCEDLVGSSKAMASECEGASVGKEVDPFGTFNFKEDGTYSLNIRWDAVTTKVLPKACRGGAECPPEPTLGKLKSSDDDTCVYELLGATYTESGTYDVHDMTIHTKNSKKNQEDPPFEFCQDGDDMSFFFPGYDPNLYTLTRTKG